MLYLGHFTPHCFLFYPLLPVGRCERGRAVVEETGLQKFQEVGRSPRLSSPVKGRGGSCIAVAPAHPIILGLLQRHSFHHKASAVYQPIYTLPHLSPSSDLPQM